MILSNRIKQILSFLFCFCSLCSAAPYDLKDLKSLANDKEFQEFFNHAKDILPKNRNRDWEGLVNKTFTEYLTLLEKTAPLNKESFQTLLKLNSWKILRNNGTRLNKMNDLLRKSLIKKFQNSAKKAVPLIKVFWIQNFNDSKIGYALGKEILRKLPDNDLGLQMISAGFRSSISDVYCSDNQIHSLLIKGLEKVYKNLNSNEEFDVKLSNYMNRKCWNALAPVLISKVEDPKVNSSQKKIIIEILSSDFSTESLIKNYARFLYMLDAPVKSNTLNKSWELLENLKNDPQMRESIIKKLTELEIIPDRTFENLKNDQNYYLARNLLKNFPEFSDSYSKKCISFLKGKQQLNPTLHCQNFYRVLRKLDFKTISPIAYEGLSPYFKNLKAIR